MLQYQNGCKIISSVLGAAEIQAYQSVLVADSFFQLLSELFEHLVTLFAVQFFIELFQSEGHNVVMMCARKGSICSDFKPQMM